MVLFLYIFLFLLRLSYRFEVVNPEVLEKIKKTSVGGSYVVALWHRNILSYMAFYHGIFHVNLVSQSRDGSLIAGVLEKIGHGVIRGSSSKGGGQAIVSFVRLLKRGDLGTITVDGPRGPAEIPKEGIFLIAKMSGSPIVPLSFKPRFYRCFEKSWDRFCFPLPFSRIEVRYGEPICVNSDCRRQDFGELRRQLQEALCV